MLPIRILTPLFLLFFTANSYSQVAFESGFFITNSGEKTECLIKNLDWHLNPSRFDYKLNENGEVTTADIHTVAAFEVPGKFRFERQAVEIDTSAQGSVAGLSGRRIPEYRSSIEFLRVIVQGELTLYEFRQSNFVRFWIKNQDGPIEDLVYKQYVIWKDPEMRQGKMLSVNDAFKQQLYLLDCPSMDKRYFNNLSYNRRSLSDFTKKYNACKGSESESYTAKIKRRATHLTIKSGARFSIYSLENPIMKRQHDFATTISPQLGIELEHVLPFNNNKWSILLEPSYNHIEMNSEKASLDYEFIEMAGGAKYSMFLSAEGRIFLSAYFINSLTIAGTQIENGQPLRLTSSGCFMLGAGYTHGRISAEARIQTPRTFAAEYIYWDSNYKSVNLILGYRLF
jgi:hypothetical protein